MLDKIRRYISSDYCDGMSVRWFLVCVMMDVIIIAILCVILALITHILFDSLVATFFAAIFIPLLLIVIADDQQ